MLSNAVYVLLRLFSRRTLCEAVVALVLVVWIVILVGRYKAVHGLYVQYEGNYRTMVGQVNGLKDVVRSYSVRDSLNAMSIRDLRITVGDLSVLYPEQSKLIRDMGIRLKDLQSVGIVSTIIHDSIPLTMDTTSLAPTATCIPFSSKGKWFSCEGLACMDSVSYLRYSVMDSLTMVRHFKRKRILWVFHGRKEYTQTDVISANPHSKPQVREWKEVEE